MAILDITDKLPNIEIENTPTNIDGVQPEYIAKPESPTDTVEILKYAHQKGIGVIPFGSGTKLGWGNPPQRCDLLINTTKLDKIIEYSPDDLIVKVQAGIKLEELQQELRKHNQMLALDPPEKSATIGGIIAANASGPRRLRYGTTRDLLIGITVALTNGDLVHGGGKVVKNVAGYDLCKLFTSSLGTLGVIVEAVFRLHPLPTKSFVLKVNLKDLDQAERCTQQILNSYLVISALEAHCSGTGEVSLWCMVEGSSENIARSAAEALRQILSNYGDCQVFDLDEDIAVYDNLRQYPWEADDLGIKFSSTISRLKPIAMLARSTSQRHGCEFELRSHAGSGITYLAVKGGKNLPVDAQVSLIQSIREALTSEDSAMVLEASLPLKQRIDVWGYAGDALPLMKRIKDQFDPAKILSPGRFVGGI